MKEKIKQLREKAKEAREQAKASYTWNACVSGGHMRNALAAIADGQDLMADVLEQLYSEEEVEEG